VRYSPTATGIHNDTIEISYTDGSGPQLSTGDVTGTGANAALLSISNGPTYDYGVIASGASLDHTFTVNNIGGVSATSIADSGGLAAPFSYKGGSYPGTGGNCGGSLNIATSCTLVVTFSPTVTGIHNDTIELNYNNGSTGVNAQRDLQGTATTPAVISIAGVNPHDFGSRALGSTTDRTFTLSNTGGVPATTLDGVGLAAPFDFKDGSYPGTGGTCGVTLNNGSNCTVIITYTPSTVALHTDTMVINYIDGVTSQSSSRDVQGTGASSALLVINDGPTYNFGDIPTGGLAEHTFVITNTGAVAATAIADGLGLAAPFNWKGGTFPGTGGTCLASLAAAATCDIVVVYSPTATGLHNDTVNVRYNNGSGLVSALRDITGTGVDPAVLVISNGPTYDFGNRSVGSTNDGTLTITNNGGYEATALSGSGLAAPYSFKAGTYPGTGGTCGATLAASASCTIVVNYQPTTLATHNDSILIDYNDGVGSQQVNRDITGVGIGGANLIISDASTYDFGTKAIGSVSEHTFTVDNTGSSQATVMSGAVLNLPFAYKGGSYPGTGGSCAASLNTASQCTIVVTYSPTASGIHNGTLTLNMKRSSCASGSG
jgi:hypothetical protein